MTEDEWENVADAVAESYRAVHGRDPEPEELDAILSGAGE